MSLAQALSKGTMGGFLVKTSRTNVLVTRALFNKILFVFKFIFWCFHIMDPSESCLLCKYFVRFGWKQKHKWWCQFCQILILGSNYLFCWDYNVIKRSYYLLFSFVTFDQILVKLRTMIYFSAKPLKVSQVSELCQIIISKGHRIDWHN